jgi:SAM-dependent methyltransferase
MDSTKRFSNRVGFYIENRPRYPQAVLSFLRDELQLAPSHHIADVGSGTGILTRLFLENGNRVFAVEPNLEMREAAEQVLAVFPDFVSVAGTAENTTLETESVDFVTAGQAFHWFDAVRAKTEFLRILRPAGQSVLIWNDRRPDADTFSVEYEELLRRFGTDYLRVNHRNLKAETFQSFYGSENYGMRIFENHQLLDLDGLKGRLLSSSYVPTNGQPGFGEMMKELQRLYEKHERGGRVVMHYNTRLFYGSLTR